MTLLKLLVLWWTIGAAIQLAMMLHLRHKYGGYISDVSTRIVLGRLWLLKMFTSCFFWPLGVYAWFTHYTPKNATKHVKSIVEQIGDRCPDCGEPLESHEDLSQ